MSFEDVMGVAQRLNVGVESLAALAAQLRLDAEGLDADPRVREHLTTIVQGLGADGLDTLTDEQRLATIGAIRAFFLQAAELVDHPERAPGWSYADPVILESQGRASMLIASLIQQSASTMPGLPERLAAPGARFLDIGSGVGWLAIAMATAHPHLAVVGIDTWDVSMRMAERHVAEVGLGERITLRTQDATTLDDEAAFDLAWVPGPFLPGEIVSTVLDRAHAALRPRGWVVFGLYAPHADPLGTALNDLRVLRSGGHPWTPAEVEVLLGEAGFSAVRTVDRTWSAPIGLVVGRR